MKFDQLRSIGHNIADSLADGHGFLVGHYFMDVFAEAAMTPERAIEVDFLTGKSHNSVVSHDATEVFRLYGEKLADFCRKHGASRSDFYQLTGRFFAENPRRFVVTVQDQHGRQVTDEYIGLPGKRIRVLDPLGRVRRQRGHVVRVGDETVGCSGA